MIPSDTSQRTAIKPPGQMRFPSRFQHLASGAIVLSCIYAASTCTTSRAPESAAKIVKNCFQAHGGIYATDSLTVAFASSTANRINEFQSLSAHPPFEGYSTRDSFWIDKPAGKLLYKQRSTTAGFVDEHLSYIDNGSGMDLNITMKTFTAIEHLPLPRNLMHHAILQGAANDTANVKLVNDSDSKATFHLLVDTIHLFINRENYLLERLQRPLYDAVFGRGTQIIAFNDYVKAGKVQIPQKFEVSRITSLYDTITNTFTLSGITSDVDIAAIEFITPSFFAPVESNTREGELRKLGPSLFFMENVNGPGGPYHALIAEFEDFLLITEAPLDRNVSQKVIQKAKELVPNKPVKYLVQSHHHNDHIGGVLGYVLEGATVVTTKDAAWLVKKMGGVFAGTWGNSLENPKIEAVNGRWKIEDKMNQCITVDIGPTPHAAQILITYFPKQKALFKADLANDHPALLKAISVFKWDVKLLVDAHDRILEGKALASLLTKFR